MAGSFYDTLIHGDWLGRSHDEYTYEKKGIGMVWHKLEDGEAYSSFLVKVASRSEDMAVERKLMLAKSACTSILNRMLIGSKETTQITFSEKSENYATFDKQKICVSLEPLRPDNKITYPSFNHALDPIIGATAHEVAHILYTDDEYANHLFKFKGVEANLKASIMNIIEDERIEKLIAENYRGYTNYVGKMKDYYLGKKFYEYLDSIPKDHKEDDITKLMEVFLNLLRYPRALREEHVNQFEPEIREFQQILTPFPETISQLVVATEEIYKVFLKFFQQQKQEEQEQQEGSGGNQPDQQGEQSKQKTKAKAQMGGGNIDSDKGEGGDQDKDEAGEKEDDSENSGGSGDKGDKQERDKKDGSGIGDDKEGENGEEKQGKGGKPGGMTEQEAKEEMAKVLAEIIEAIEDAQPMKMTPSEIAQIVFPDEYSTAVEKALKAINEFDNDFLDARQSETHKYPDLANCKAEEMQILFKPITGVKAKDNHYDKALKEVSMYSSSLRAKLSELNRNVEITNTGLFEGNFDDGLLVDAIVGAKNVYNETFKMQNRGVCIGLLGDESGSMSHNDAWYLNLKIAVMFERALVGLNNVDFFCYGHTTGSDPKIPGSYDVTLIKTYFEGRKKGDRKTLGKIYNHGGNRDGHAILETACRIRNQIPKDLPLVLFVVSDGMPSSSVPDGFTQKSYVKHVVDMIEKTMNATIIHIAIHQSVPSEDMFNNYVKFTNFRTLVTDMGKLLKKIVTKFQQPITI